MIKKLIQKIFRTKEQGLLAIFKDPEALKVAASKVRRNLYITKFDVFTPFPVHGIEKAMGLSRSFIPWLTLVYGLTGAGLLFLFQAWTSSESWPINVGGKPFISWPAFIPITFEGGILFGGVLTVLTLLHFLRLPNFFQKVMDERLTKDRFGLFVDKTDRCFIENELRNLFKECGAEEIKEIDHQ